MRLPNINTRFALPIICPVTGEEVSAETLYNAACDAMGRQVCDHIGDLVFDNLDYSADETVCGTDDSNAALHDAIYAWADSVRTQIAAETEDTAVFSYYNSSDARIVVYGAKIAFPSPSDCVWMIPGTWQIWPKSY